MNFLDKNGFRAALVIAVIFLAMPFMFPERVPVNDKGNAADSAQPVKSKKFLTGIFDRIGSFYGFKKNKKSAIDQALDKLKKEADGTSADKKAEGAAATQNSLETPAAGGAGSSGGSAGGSSFETGSSSSKAGYTAAAARAAKPRLSLGGKDYEVVKDLYGNDYAITDRGPIAVNSLLAKGGVLKYPSGKTVSRTGVVAEEYNPGGGANPYSSLSASSKVGGSYKGGKKGGSVASTRKISSGFSLSSGGGGIAAKSSRRRGASSDFVNNVSLAEAYDNVQTATASIADARHTPSLEDQTVYYEVASPAAARATTAAPTFSSIPPQLLQGESMFADAVPASPWEKGSDKLQDVKPADTAKGVISLDMDNTPTVEVKPAKDNTPAVEVKSAKDNTKKKVAVDINLNNPVGFIPKNKELLRDMTKKLLGDDVNFESTKTSTGEVIPDPWIFPAKVPSSDIYKNKFALGFWTENQDALVNAKADKEGNSYSDPRTWGKSDTFNDEVAKAIKKQNIPVSVVVVDGSGTGSKKNYYQQMGDYITGHTAGSEGTKQIIVVQTIEEKEKIPNTAYVIVHHLGGTPEDIKAFGSGIQTQVNLMEEAAAEKKKQGQTASEQTNVISPVQKKLTTGVKSLSDNVLKIQINNNLSKGPND